MTPPPTWREKVMVWYGMVYYINIIIIIVIIIM